MRVALYDRVRACVCLYMCACDDVGRWWLVVVGGVLVVEWCGGVCVCSPILLSLCITRTITSAAPPAAAVWRFVAFSGVSDKFL